MLPNTHRLLCAALLVWLLTSCNSVDGIVSTEQPTDTSLPIGLPTIAQGPSDIPTDISGLLPPECDRPDERVYDDFRQEYLLMHYGEKGCKLTVVSPDGNYLAYVSLDRQEDNEAAFFADTVHVLNLSKGDDGAKVHTAHNKNFVSLLEWTSTGQLIIWESIWEGTFVLFVFDVTSNSILAKMRADEMVLRWNPQATAFYVIYAGSYGRDVCVQELSGYDFASGNSLPDFYRLFDIQKIVEGPFGIPYAEEDSLKVDPFAWSEDGNRLWLTITALDWKGDDYRYELRPREAGVLEFSETGISYMMLAADPRVDYSFEGLPDPSTVSDEYEPIFCP